MNFNTNLEHQIVSSNSHKMQESGFMYDIEGEPNFPDVPQLLASITDVLEYMCDDSMVKLQEDDFNEFESHMEAKFPEFTLHYYAIFQRLIHNEDLTMLFEMLKEIHRVNCGEDTAENIERKLGEQLGKKYITKSDTKKKNKKKNKNKK